MIRIIFALTLVALIASCGEEKTPLPENGVWHLSCDAEKLDGDKLVGTNEQLLSGGSARSKKKARSGKYSVRLNKKNSYGFNYILENVKKGTVIDVSCWKNADAKSGAMVIASFDGDNNYVSSGHIKEHEGNWGKMKLMYVAPKDFDSLSVYVYNLADKSVYFDDFNITAYTNVSKPKIAAKQKVLRIQIPQSAADSLDRFKKKALQQEVITSDLKEYVKAYVEVNGQKAPVELRIKGDWTDHVKTEKVSFRIKMGDGYAFDGLRTFSIQNPETRSFIMEWFAHQLFEYEDVLTTRYEMIPVFINGKNMGVYALEEHFDKQLLEARNRREGPIMKFDESGVWQIHLRMALDQKYTGAPGYESAEISVFKKNRTKKNPTLLAQFTSGQSKMEKLRKGYEGADQYMDIESTAKFLALVELINGKHGLTWHNNRYYMNPITQRLEPIGFDCFMDYNKLIREHKLLGLYDPNDDTYSTLRSLLQDEHMRERYEFYLKKYAQPEFLKTVYSDLAKKIKNVEALIQQEYPNIKLDKSFFEYNRKQIANNVSKLKNKSIEVNRAPKNYQPLPDNFIYDDIALKGNVEARYPDGSALMSLRNYHSHTIEIVGYSTKENKKLLVPMESFKLAPYDSKSETVKTLKFPVKPRRIHYKAANCGETIFKCNPEEWKVASVTPDWPKTTNVMVPDENNEVHLRGLLSFSQDVVVPKCKALIIEPGSAINLKNNAALVSYAPVKVNGTEAEPIHIYSSDHSSNGFVVLSPEKSVMTYANFDHLSTMNKYNWVLTGAVTFYNAEVDLDHCSFTNNHCEDALNTIRCEIDVRNCTIDGTYSDGFDADFCTGTLSTSSFSNTGNDCIDFSGSTITISDCDIRNSGDKGISGGEGSTLTVKNCKIDGATIAVASKDKSTVTISDITISNADYAFSAYRKKPEYGAATLIVTSVKKNDATELYLLEKDSQLRYLNKEYIGKEVFDIDAMYAEFSK